MRKDLKGWESDLIEPESKTRMELEGLIKIPINLVQNLKKLRVE
jgi:hypothetical protein